MEAKMKTKDQEEIREAVRQAYGKVARWGEPVFEMAGGGCCCSRPESISASLGYSKKDLECAPAGANMGLGCGNPTALASIKAGETVVDLGSGGGFDCFLASKAVGPTGKVIGVDMTPEMVSKSRKIAEDERMDNVEFRLGEIEHLPMADNSVDIILSNCVINLSPDKASVFRDAFRVLKPGGRLAISDILALSTVPEEVKRDLNLISACIGGAATVAETEEMLTKAGFVNIRIRLMGEGLSSFRERDPRVDKALDYVTSAAIEAVKPAKG
jgi:arsenite methyltransferase